MYNGLYNGLDNGLHNGVYNGLSDGLKNGLFYNESKSLVKDLVLLLDAGNRNSYSPNSSGTKWNDLTLNNYNGVLINGSTFNYANNGYINCDGSNDYIEIANSDTLKFESNNFSVEYWFRKKTTTVGAGFANIWGVGKWISGGSPGQNEWAIFLAESNSNIVNFQVEVGVYSYSSGNYPISINQWYQVVGIRNNEKIQLYVNGVLRQEGTSIFFDKRTKINNTGKKIRLNNSYLDMFYTAADNAVLRIYKKALSKEEVRNNFNELRGRFGL